MNKRDLTNGISSVNTEVPFLSFGSKAETLELLSQHSSEIIIPPCIHFHVLNWASDANSVLNKIKTSFSGKLLAIRSSAAAEDTYASSNAGAFLSLLNIDSNNDNELKDAIRQVIQAMPGDPKDQVLVQEMATDIEVSGVAFTRCVDDGAPYYVVNYDDESGETDRVTGGIGVSKTVHIFRGVKDSDFRSERIKNIISLCKKLELIFNNDALDVEFGINKDNRLLLFQVRPIAATERWTGQADAQVVKHLSFIEDFFQQCSQPRPEIYGKQALFGVMPDWNPAEMLGILPRPLATSLYRELITRNTWRLAREEMGYHPVPYGDLMVLAAGRPYIDVRQSFNSLLPSGLPPAVSEKIINAWLDRLHDHPELHDKVEFAIASTCLDFNFNTAWEERYPGLLSREEAHQFKEKLKQVTVTCFDPEGSIRIAEQKVELLEQCQKNRPDPVKSKSKLAQIIFLLEETQRLGTIPFSVLARHAFIAETVLRSAVARGALEQPRLNELRMSIVTIAGNISDELTKVASGKASKSDFLRVYGHLRPGSYDLLSPRYQDREDLFNVPLQHGLQETKHEFQFSAREQKALDDLFREYTMPLNADCLLAYARTAIAGREYAKFVFSKNLSDILELVAAWGAEHGFSRDDMSFLPIAMLTERLVQGPLKPLQEQVSVCIAEQKELFSLAQALRLPYLITSPDDVKIVPQHRSSPNYVSQKKIIAPVVRLSSQAGGENLSDCIVCIENADPGFDWIFSRGIAGLVTKFGGANSHMAVRCAEYSLPAAIGCGEKLFEEIAASTKAELDSSAHILRIIEH